MDINGVSLSDGSTTEDQKHLMVYVANTEPILVKLDEGSSIGTSDKIGSVGDDARFTLNLNPKPDDFNSLKGNLKAIVPTGFILLHNDLQELIKGKKVTGEAGDSGGFFSSLSGVLMSGGLTGSMAAIGSAAGAAAGSFIGAGIGGIISGLFGGDTPTETHMKGIIEELNLRMTVDDFEDDPEILAEQRKAFIRYLKTYYFMQTAELAGDGVGKTAASVVTGAAQELVQEVVSSLLGIVGLDDIYDDPFEKVVKEVAGNINPDDYKNLKEVKDTQQEAIINYLKTYYALQISQMAAEEAGKPGMSFFSGMAKELVQGVMGSLLGIVGLDDIYDTPFEKIVKEIAASINVSDYTGEGIYASDIKDAQSKAVLEYLKEYYRAQTDNMTSEMEGQQTTSKFTGALQGTVQGILESFGSLVGLDDIYDSAFESIVKSLANGIDVADYTDEGTYAQSVKNVQSNAILAYLREYYQAQIDVMSSKERSKDNWMTQLQNSIASSLGNIFELITGKTDKNPFVDAVSAAASQISITDVDQSDLTEVKSNSIVQGAKAILDINVQALKSNYSIDGWFSGYTDILNDALDTVRENYLDALKIQVASGMIVDRNSITRVKTEAITKGVETVFEVNREALEYNYRPEKTKINKKSYSDYINEVFGSIAQDYVDAVGKNANLSLENDKTLIVNVDQIKSTMTEANESIGNSLMTIDSSLKEYSNRLKEELDKSLESINESLAESITVDNSTEINNMSTYDDTNMRMLIGSISTQLSNMLVILRDMRDNPNTPIVVNQPSNDDIF